MKIIPSIALFCLLSSAVITTQTASAQTKPNIVYILVDNWGWGDISLQGITHSLTAH